MNTPKAKINVSFLGICILISTTIALSFTGKLDKDILWHFKLGEEIINTKTISMIDTFSWQPGLSWVQQEWLYDLLLYGIISLLGTTGMFFLHCLTSIAAFYGGAVIGKAKNYVLYLFFAFTAFMLLPLNRGNRPSEFSAWFFILLIWMWRCLKKHGVFWMFPFAILAANFHGGTIMTLMIVLLLLSATELFCDFRKYKVFKQQNVKECLLPLIVFFAGSLLCPSFYRMWTISPFLPGWNSTLHIPEWMPWEIGYVEGVFLLSLTLSLGYALYKTHFSKAAVQDTAVLCAFIITTMASTKAGNILFLLLLILGYPYFEDLATVFFGFLFMEKMQRIVKRISPPHWAVFILCGALSFILCTADTYEMDFTVHANKDHSLKILSVLKELPEDTRILNGYLEGNVLLFNDIKCFIDSRQFPYATEYEGNTSLDDYIAALTTNRPDVDAIASFLSTYNFDYLYVTDTMENLSWYLNYADTAYVCVLQDNAKGEALWKKQP